MAETVEISEITGTQRLPPKSSRIFIKNLPQSNFNDEALRKHFSKFSEITDCRFFPDRRIAFIGYKTPQQAEAAVKYFDRSFIKTSKLSVEIAKSAKNGATERGRSSQAQEPSIPGGNQQLNDGASTISKNLKRKRGESEPTSKPEEKKVDENDPKYREFMQLMQSNGKTKIWENEAAILTEEQPKAISLDANNESEDEYEDLSSKKKSERKKVKETASTDSTKDDTLDVRQGSIPDDEDILPDANDPPPTISDADWLKSRTNGKSSATEVDKDSSVEPIDHQTDKTIETVDIDEDMEDAPSPSQMTQEPSEQIKTEQDISIEKISETGRLFLRNLTYSVTEDDLTELFNPFGSLEEVHLPFDPKTHKPKGFAYVLFSEPDHAVEAFKTLDQQIFQGRNLHILPGQAKRESMLDDFALSKLPLKKQREIQKKRAAAKSEFEWNSLYMNINSVMASVATRLGVSKSEILDPTSSDAAVKQAHAETRIIQETKQYFESHGVDLAAFSRKKRGDKIILIKNFSYGVSIEDLKTLCDEFGETKRVLMPPTGTIAIVEYKDDPSGRSAFTKLYGRKFKDSILKVEKGPVDLFIKPPEPPKPDNNVQKNSISDLLSQSTESQPQIGETFSLFVKNLNFSTTSAKLHDIFSPLNGYISSRVKSKPDPKRSGQTLSMGYGFVEFRDKQSSETAQKAMNGYSLDGHKLEIKSSHKSEDLATEKRKEDESRKKSAIGTKIIIKNLAFEVSEKQLRNLFSQYGKLKSIRLPKKFNKSSRGFGFAQFVSTKEAENAMSALKHTHLHGRPLVLEWAKEDAKDAEDEIERLQKKVGKQVDSVKFAKLSGAAGRKKFDIERMDVEGEDGGDN